MKEIIEKRITKIEAFEFQTSMIFKDYQLT